MSPFGWVIVFFWLVEKVVIFWFLIHLTKKLNKTSQRQDKAIAAQIDSIDLTNRLLTIVKGWTLVHDKVTKTAVLKISEKATEQTKEVKKAIDEVPGKTAEIVAERLTSDGKSSTEIQNPLT